MKKMCICFHMFFKSSVGFGLSNCLNAKKKNTFGMRNTQYSIELSVHKQASVFNTTYTIQCHVNCQNVYIVIILLYTNSNCVPFFFNSFFSDFNSTFNCNLPIGCHYAIHSAVKIQIDKFSSYYYCRARIFNFRNF